MGPLISAKRLQESAERVKVFDLRWSLTDPEHGLSTYLRGHIPGALFVDLDSDLSSPPGEGRHPLPRFEDFIGTLGRLGVEFGDPVVVYDDARGAIAARLWWMMVAIGHDNVALLDGGYQAWVDAGYPTEPGRSFPPRPKEYLPIRRHFHGVADHRQLAGREVIDVRDTNRYTGEYEPVDPKAGHIPGSVNIPLRLSLDDDGRLREPGELRSLFAAVGDQPVISCGSGVNACHTALAMRVAGLELPDIYIGSFSDWSSRDLPVKTGPEP